MKSYKDFRKDYIGFSDIASLILVGCGENGLKLQELHFGGDGTYKAYVVKEKDVEIGEHYKKVADFSSWLKIYDDEGLSYRVDADYIVVYRAAEMGCIIHAYNNEKGSAM